MNSATTVMPKQTPTHIQKNVLCSTRTMRT
jgi:hypothetical protein